MSNPLFSSFKYKNLTLKNRIVMAPMTRGFSPDGVPGDDVVAYYQRRARAEVGLIVTPDFTARKRCKGGIKLSTQSMRSMARWRPSFGTKA